MSNIYILFSLVIFKLRYLDSLVAFGKLPLGKEEGTRLPRATARRRSHKPHLRVTSDWACFEPWAREQRPGGDAFKVFLARRGIAFYETTTTISTSQRSGSLKGMKESSPARDYRNDAYIYFSFATWACLGSEIEGKDMFWCMRYFVMWFWKERWIGKSGEKAGQQTNIQTRNRLRNTYYTR